MWNLRTKQPKKRSWNQSKISKIQIWIIKIISYQIALQSVSRHEYNQEISPVNCQSTFFSHQLPPATQNNSSFICLQLAYALSYTILSNNSIGSSVSLEILSHASNYLICKLHQRDSRNLRTLSIQLVKQVWSRTSYGTSQNAIYRII